MGNFAIIILVQASFFILNRNSLSIYLIKEFLSVN